jgi:hypothetical protein
MLLLGCSGLSSSARSLFFVAWRCFLGGSTRPLNRILTPSLAASGPDSVMVS